ncbi:endo alpha-1,4 polygalactosaminidase [Alcanivorax sp. 24]|uniref:endo alpha-1,4 polygalactosaminidase n=1 Tax=Alcanivorax sp. 24 TaxID=2545266 RepID=UPI001060EAD2|nr:endo alpha-1,4 polygalactosaminidase [Alcanivorax sp. 24]
MSTFLSLPELLSTLLGTAALVQPALANGGWYQPAMDVNWQVQLQGTPDTHYDMELYVLDLFDTEQSVIGGLHAQGAKMICYFSAGTFENWRDDAGRFLPGDKGRRLGNWPGERWLDIRSQNVREIMADRLDLAVEKGCDGVDPDNVDGYSNHTGLPLTYQNQLDYNIWLAGEAHQRGLAVSLKNDLGQIQDLVAHFDFAINESCHEWDECELLTPFTQAGKPVLHIDYLYANDPVGRDQLCLYTQGLGFRTLTLPELLDGSFRLSCNP